MSARSLIYPAGGGTSRPRVGRGVNRVHITPRRARHNIVILPLNLVMEANMDLFLVSMGMISNDHGVKI